MAKKQKEEEKIKFRLEKSEFEEKINFLIPNIQTVNKN